MRLHCRRAAGTPALAAFTALLALTVAARAPVLLSLLCLLSVPPPPARAAPAGGQEVAAGAPRQSRQSRPPRQPQLSLARALERISRQTGVLAVADSGVAYERVPAPALAAGETPVASETPAAAAPGAPTAQAEAAAEEQVRALVRALPPGTTWGKLYLPAPPPGRQWRGDDVAAFAFAQARLFGTAGAPSADGGIEILGRRVDRASAPAYVRGLGLRPVFLVSHPGRATSRAEALTAAGGGAPWSPLPEERWAALTREEREQYGRQQAAWIASLPPEQRDRMLERIRQHDRYFESVKGPLEKLLGPGHGL